MRRILLAAAFFLAFTYGSRAQFARDTLSLRSDFKASQLIAPALLLGSGVAINRLAHESIDLRLRDYVQDDLRRGGELRFYDIGSYLQYVPTAAHLGLGLTGIKSRHSFFDRLIESAIANVVCFGTTRTLKYVFKEKRPDSDVYTSFPSGHTAVAFTGAELMRMDYGNAWGAGAYAVALFCGAERVWGDRHWFSDVLAGMGAGILSAKAGGWLLKPVKRLFGVPDYFWDGFAFVPYVDPLSGTFSASLALQF